MSLGPKQQPQNLKLMLIQTCELPWSWGTDGSRHLLKPSSCLSWVFLMSTCSRTNWYCFYSPWLQVLSVQISPGGEKWVTGCPTHWASQGCESIWMSLLGKHPPPSHGKGEEWRKYTSREPLPNCGRQGTVSQCAGSVEEASGQEITQLFNIPSKRLTPNQQGIRPYQTKHARSLTKNKTFN